MARADGLAGDDVAVEHLPSRPSWNCRTCGRPWPCADAKATLAAEFRGLPSVLAIYLAAHMKEALTDLTDDGAAAPPQLYERFFAWITR